MAERDGYDRRMTRPLASFTSILVLAIVGIGCGGSGSSGDSGDSGGSKTPKKAGSSKADVSVSMKDIQFKPMNVTVKRGQTIRWSNNDSVTHNVTKDGGPGAGFKSDNVNPGGTFQTTLDAPGKISYLCTIHPNQTGTITVK